MRSCISCGSPSTETAFPRRGRMCCDCVLDPPKPVPERNYTVTTRASVAAVLREKRKRMAEFTANGRQTDLVEYLEGLR